MSLSSLHTQILLVIDSGFDGSIDIADVELIQSLTEFDTLYAGEIPGNESPLTDGQYDALRAYVKTIVPTSKYFLGVGSDVRGGKVDLPYEMGSLDQVEIGDIEEWVRKNKLQNEDHVVSDKMDGTSAMLIYDENGDPQIAYSRGDGVQGADISRHIFKIKHVPTKLIKILDTGLDVRAEVELTETGFKSLFDAGVRRRGGEPYKNSRNMVAGLMNSKTIPDVCYDHLTVVCYEVLGLPASKVMQLRLLEANGFQVVKYSVLKGNQLTDKFLAAFLTDRKDNLDYAIDGLVIEVDDAIVRQRMNPTKETLNPKYSIKYKVADASNHAIATVRGVTWNISKHGYLKPQINIEPVELVGVTISNCTGFNARFIFDNGIGPGATINLTRSGDVIPFCTSVVTKAFPQMPGMIPEQIDWDWDWNDTKVDAVLKDHADNSEVAIQQTLDFFASVEAPHLKEGTIRKLFELHEYADAKTAILTMLAYDVTQWVNYIGENGNKIHNGIFNKFNEIPLYVLMGSLPFFDRGVGKRKFKKLEVALGSKAVHGLNYTNRLAIARVPGFSDTTADKILGGMDDYHEFFSLMPKFITVTEMKDTSGGCLDGKKICFTGFRNPTLQQEVEELGGTLQSTVNSQTNILVIKDPSSTSGKAKKAHDLGVTLMGIDEFKDLIK